MRFELGSRRSKTWGASNEAASCLGQHIYACALKGTGSARWSSFPRKVTLAYHRTLRSWRTIARVVYGGKRATQGVSYMICWHTLMEEPNNRMGWSMVPFSPDCPSTGINLSYVSQFSFPYLIISHDRDSPISPFLCSHILVERRVVGWVGYTFRYLRSSYACWPLLPILDTLDTLG